MTMVIVEGDGDEFSVPILLGKTLGKATEISCMDMNGKGHIVRERKGFEDVVVRQNALGAKKFRILLDFDVVFPPYKNLQEEIDGMTKRAKELQKQYSIDVTVCWAVRSFESWLIGGLTKGSAYCGLERINKPVSGDTEAAPEYPKQWLKDRLTDSRYNTEVQECLTKNVNWTQARKRNKSLQKFIASF